MAVAAGVAAGVGVAAPGGGSLTIAGVSESGVAGGSSHSLGENEKAPTLACAG